MGVFDLRFSPPFWPQDDERFYQALVFSLALHAVLLYWWPQHPVSRETGSPELTVTFTRANAVPQRASTPPAPPKAETGRLDILTRESAADIAFPAREDKKRLPPAPPGLTAANASDPASTAIMPETGTSATGNEAVRPSRKRGKASMVIEVGDDGRIGQIIWDKLPAMDRDTFNRLEAAIRARGYSGPAPGRFLTQTIDVRDYLDPETPK